MTSVSTEPVIHKVPQPKLRPVRTLATFFFATFLTDLILLAIDSHRPHPGQPEPSPFALRLLVHGVFDLLSLTIVWFGIKSRAKGNLIEERPWFVAAACGVVFSLLLYGLAMIPASALKVTDPGNQDWGQNGRSWPILVYFLFPLATAAIATRRRPPSLP